VCAQHGQATEGSHIFQRVQVPYVRESPNSRGRLCPEALASRKGGGSDPTSEGSETAKPGTDEQKPDKRL